MRARQPPMEIRAKILHPMLHTITPQVTFVVTQRERFIYTKQSLANIYACTDVPFEMLYGDGESPKHMRRYLEREAAMKAFHLIRQKGFMSPNRAHNMALIHAEMEYVLFVDHNMLEKRR